MALPRLDDTKRTAFQARNAIVLVNIVGFGVIAALDVWGIFYEARPATKVFVVIHLFFTLGFITKKSKTK